MHVVHKMKMEIINVIYPHVQISQIVSELDLMPRTDWITDPVQKKYPHQVLMEEKKIQDRKREVAQLLKEKEQEIAIKMELEDSQKGSEIDNLDDPSINNSDELDGNNQLLLLKRDQIENREISLPVLSNNDFVQNNNFIQGDVLLESTNREKQSFPAPPEKKRVPGELKVIENKQPEEEIPKFRVDEEEVKIKEDVGGEEKLKNEEYYAYLKERKIDEKELELAIQALHDDPIKHKAELEKIKEDYEAKIEQERLAKVAEIERERQERQRLKEEAEKKRLAEENEEFEYQYNAIVSRERNKKEAEEEEAKKREEEEKAEKEQAERDRKIEEEVQKRKEAREIDKLYTADAREKMYELFEKNTIELEKKTVEDKLKLEQERLEMLKEKLRIEEERQKEEIRQKEEYEKNKEAMDKKKKEEEEKKKEQEKKEKEERHKKREEKREEKRHKVYNRLDVPRFEENAATKALEGLAQLNYDEVEAEWKLCRNCCFLRSLRRLFKGYEANERPGGQFLVFFDAELFFQIALRNLGVAVFLLNKKFNENFRAVYFPVPKFFSHRVLFDTK